MANVTTAHISEYGLLLLYATDASSGQLRNITAIASNPTITVNGVAVALTGPWWGDQSTTHYLTFVCYRPIVDILATDTVLYTASSGWATANALPLPAATGAAVSNYVGQSEPGVGNFAGVAVSAWNTTPVMKLGYDIGSTCVGSCYSFWQDWQRFIFSVAGALTTDPTTGRPITCNGNVTFSLGPMNNTGAADSRGMPVVMGQIDYIVDETAPATPMRLSLTSSSNVTITGPVITPGVLTGGVEVGRKFTWQAAYTLANPVAFTAGFNFSTKTPSGSSGPYTLTNERLFMPGAGTPGTSKFALHPYVRAWCTTPSGKTPDSFRWMDVIRGGDGISNAVHPADDRQPNAWGLGIRTVRTATITSVNYYDVSISNKVWLEQQFPNVIATGGGPSPYYLTPVDRGYANNGGPLTGLMCGELQLAAPATPAPLFTGQCFATLNGTSLNGLPCSNGDGPPLTVNLNTLTFPCWVTSATTLAFYISRGGFKNNNGQPGSINGILGTNPVTGATVTDVIPNAAASIDAAIEATAEMPGTAFWFPTPQSAAVDHVMSDLNKVLAGIPAGTKVRHSISNEVWSPIPPQQVFKGYGGLGAFTPSPIDWPEAFVHHCKWAWDMGDAAFAAAGRIDDYVHVLDSQLGNPTVTQILIARVNTWNAANPTNPIRVDAVAVAPYMDPPTDLTIQRACAQTYSIDPRSIAFGDANPFTMAQWLDLFSHWIRYNTKYNGHVSPGWYGQTLTQVNLYVPVAGQPPGFHPPIHSYEAQIERLIDTGGVSLDAQMNLQILHDLTYHPVMAKVHRAFYLGAQDGGFTSLCIQTLAGQRCLLGLNVWGDYTWAGQVPGDGSTNHFWITDNFGHDGPANGFPANVSVRGYAWQQWADVANAPNLGSSTGSGAITLGSLAALGVGTVSGATATGAIGLVRLTVAGTGRLMASSTGGITLGLLIVAGAGTATGPINATGAITLGSLATAGVATATGPLTNAAGSVLLSSLAVGSAATFTATASAAIGLDALEASGTGTWAESMSGFGEVTLAALTANGVGTVTNPPPLLVYVDPRNARLATLASAFLLVVDTAGFVSLNNVLSIGKPPHLPPSGTTTPALGQSGAGQSSH